MPRPASGARERFVAATLTLLRQGGLSAAGLNDVVALARAPKGSLYHYFPGGKTQMVTVTIEGYREWVAAQIALALQGRASLRHRVRRLFDGVAERMAAAQFTQSCAVGAVVLDLRASDKQLRSLCKLTLANWAETAAAHLHDLPAADRVAAGRFLVNLLEGSQLASRAAADSAPLREAALAFVTYAQGLATARGKAPSSAQAETRPRKLRRRTESSL
jgi:TetR/AcrR family transcriptional regulator, lmrAB and yxaGH operons repressor